jgi:hypothetical protein
MSGTDPRTEAGTAEAVLLLKQVLRCLHALRNELRTAAACADALRTLAERALLDESRLAG